MAHTLNWKYRSAICVAAVLFSGCDGCNSRSPQVGHALPASADQLLLNVGLTRDDLRASEFVDDGTDGWWVGIPADMSVLRYFEKNWLPVDQQPPDRSKGLRKSLWRNVPPRWEACGNSPSAKLYIEPRYDPGIEGTENRMVLYSEKDKYLLIWCQKNF